MAMMTLKLPKLAVSMQEGTITEWLVPDGSQVALGQAIYLIETEKTVTEIESPFSGRISLLFDAGTTCMVGTPIASIEV